MTASLTLEWTPQNASRRRFVFRRQETGEWVRLEKIWQEGGWLLVNQEVVTDIEFSRSKDKVATPVTVYRGP